MDVVSYNTALKLGDLHVTQWPRSACVKSSEWSQALQLFQESGTAQWCWSVHQAPYNEWPGMWYGVVANGEKSVSRRSLFAIGSVE